MATYTDAKQNKESKIPSTNEQDILNDAKSYARTEFTSICKLFDDMKIKYTEEELAKAWIKVKFDQIKTSREARKTFFD